MLRLPDAWLWDAWYARDGGDYHVFFLHAPRALGDASLRHRGASIGHAVSTDLATWERLEDAVVHGDAPDFDHVAPWTGSVVRGDDQRWYLFYTGTAAGTDGHLVQRIGLAVSEDLRTWHKHPANPLVSADPRWYETLGGPAEWADEHWRDPWVFRDPEGHGWHMLITARANTGPWDQRGVLGHATSKDLVSWEVDPPLTPPGAGFGLMEVPQVVEIDGRTSLVVNCPRHQLGADRAALGPGGVWVVPAASPLGPYDLEQATLLADERWYVGKLMQDPRGDWVCLAFVFHDEDGRFVGELTDPMPVRWVSDRLVLDHPGGNTCPPSTSDVDRVSRPG